DCPARRLTTLSGRCSPSRMQSCIGNRSLQRVTAVVEGLAGASRGWTMSDQVRTPPKRNGIIAGMVLADPDQAFPLKYEKPPYEEGVKSYAPLARCDHLVAIVQVLREGGENQLHSHKNMDGFWFVLSGRVRFYGEDDVVLAECGTHEGILIPRTVKYWFES